MFHPRGPTFFELVRQALSSTERGYDLLAPKFDVTPFRTPDAVLEAAAEVLGGPGSVGSAVDLCCGTGAALEMLRPLCRERLAGVDFSRGMLAVAGERLAADVGSIPVDLVHGDVLDGLGERELDVVTCFGALGHFRRRHQDRLVAHVARALRPGGRFVFATADRPPPWSWRLWLAAAFDAAMAVRNLLWRPPFVMYYLGFLLPRAKRLLARHGFAVEVHRAPLPASPRLCLVVARLSPARAAACSPGREPRVRDGGGEAKQTATPTRSDGRR